MTDDLDDLLAYIAALEAENKELRAELVQKMARGVKTYPDGSTSRHIDRINCQEIAEEVITFWLQEDSLGALQTMERCRNDAERAHIHNWMNTKQRNWLKTEEALARSPVLPS